MIRIRQRSSVAVAAALLILLACCTPTRRSDPSPPATASAAAVGHDVPLGSATASAPPPASSASAAPSADAAAPPTGVATLVVEKVYAECAVGGWAGTNEKVHYLGTDLFVLVQGDGDGEKPRKEFVFCPSELADGGRQKVKLSLWQYCSAFPSCRVLAPDAGSGSRVEVQCGKEKVVLENDGARTIIRGSFGERTLAPGTSRILPPKLGSRKASVDC